MKIFFRLLAPAILCLAVSSAHAQQLDMGEVTCQDMQRMNEQEMSMLYFWLDGYASRMSQNNILDLGVVEENLNALSEYCENHPTGKVLDFVK